MRLLEAAARDDVSDVQKLLATGLDINSTDERGYTALYSASKHNSLNTVKYLLQQGAQTDLAERENQYTALIVASEQNNVDIVSELLQYPTQVNAQDKSGCGALLLAASKGHRAVVSALLRHGADVNLSKGTGATPLYMAAYTDHSDVVDVLIQHGAGINVCRRDGATPLYIAAKEGHIKVVESLLRSGADLEKRHQSGATALSKACSGQHTQVVELLCAEGADVNGQDNYGYTPLHKAVEVHGVKAVWILLQYNTQLLKTNTGQTALDIARNKNYVDIVVKLENHFTPGQHHSDSGREEGSLSPQQKSEADAMYKKIRQSYAKFVTNLSPMEHADELFSQEVLDMEDMERIKAQPGIQTRSRQLMETLMAKPAHLWVRNFAKSLQDSEASQHLAALIKE